MKILKVIFININIFVMGLIIISLFSMGAIHFYSSVRSEHKAHLPNYNSYDWAESYWRDAGEVKQRFVAYIGWQPEYFKSETLNISRTGQRRTVMPLSPKDKSVFFFGGSTMFGSGSNDEHTIPSRFAALAQNYETTNFGQSGYTSHQSLNVLTKQYLEGFRPDLVIFYDGANEVLHKCRRDLDFFSYSHEKNIRERLGSPLHDPLKPSYFLGSIDYSLKKMLTKINRLYEKRNPERRAFFYDCANNSNKREKIAHAVVLDWVQARGLVESYGGKFVAILQPVAYLSDTRTSHLDLGPALGEQFNTVYPLIQKLVNEDYLGIKRSVYDFTSVFDIDEYIYIDFAHVSPNGNSLVAQSLYKNLGN